MLGNIWFYMWLLVVVLVIADMLIGVRKANELLKSSQFKHKRENELELMAIDQSALNDRVTDLERSRDARNLLDRAPLGNLLDGPYKLSKTDKQMKKIVGKVVDNLKKFVKIAEKETMKDKK